MKKKSGMFKLEPDKFSIHTFEISKKLTNQDYKKMRDRLYCRCPRGEMYQDRDWQGEGERFRCRWFRRNGLRISLEKDVHGQISTCYLRVAVNPRKLIDPDSSYLSHQAGTCGLHVHVSRKAFGDTYDAQDSAIARVLYFVECHWRELLRFSRRTQRQMDQWAARYGYRDRPDEMLEHVKKGSGSRYTCVNLNNCDTIEFRMFRGTLKLNTLLATLQMVDHICDVAIYLSDDELRDLSWSGFVSGIKEPELIQYLKERNLYINEPTEAEGEI